MLKLSSPLLKKPMPNFSHKKKLFRESSTMPLTTFLSLRRKFTKLTRLLWSFWSSLKMLRSRLIPWSSTLLTWSRESLCTFQWRKTQLTESLLNSSTTTQKDRSSRSCSCVSLKVSTNSERREWPSKLKKTTSRLELVEATFLLMSSWISTLQLSLRSSRERIHWRDSARKLLSRRPSSMQALESPLQSGHQVAPLQRESSPCEPLLTMNKDKVELTKNKNS